MPMTLATRDATGAWTWPESHALKVGLTEGHSFRILPIDKTLLKFCGLVIHPRLNQVPEPDKLDHSPFTRTTTRRTWHRSFRLMSTPFLAGGLYLLTRQDVERMRLFLSVLTVSAWWALFTVSKLMEILGVSVNFTPNTTFSDRKVSYN